VATDGSRLSKKDLSGSYSLLPALLVPARAVVEVARLSGGKGELKVCRDANNNQLIFMFGNFALSTRLVEAQFPPFNKVIPSAWQIEVTADKEELLQALKTAAIFARESSNIIKISVGDNLLTISANSSSTGDDKTEIEAKVKGGEVSVAFNVRFVIDFLNSINSSSVLMKLGGSLSPVIFQDSEDLSLIHVIMPVRLAGITP
jgi:DNA polymerase-3 subunit beta